MTNPAAGLLEILQGWTAAANADAATSRGLSANSMEGWPQQTLAASYLRQIERYLNGMQLDGVQGVEVYFRALPSWYAAVYNLTMPLASADHPRRALGDTASITLETLALQMTSTGYSPTFNEATSTELIAHLAESYELVHADRTVNTTERRQVMALIQAALDIVSASPALPSSAVRSAVQEAAGATISYAIELRIGEPEKAKRLGSLGMAIATAVVTGLTNDAFMFATQLLSTHTGLALPPGS